MQAHIKELESSLATLAATGVPSGSGSGSGNPALARGMGRGGEESYLRGQAGGAVGAVGTSRGRGVSWKDDELTQSQGRAGRGRSSSPELGVGMGDQDLHFPLPFESTSSTAAAGTGTGAGGAGIEDKYARKNTPFHGPTSPTLLADPGFTVPRSSNAHAGPSTLPMSMTMPNLNLDLNIHPDLMDFGGGTGPDPLIPALKRRQSERERSSNQSGHGPMANFSVHSRPRSGSAGERGGGAGAGAGGSTATGGGSGNGQTQGMSSMDISRASSMSPGAGGRGRARDVEGLLGGVSKAPSLAEHHAALVLEDIAFSRNANLERANMHKTIDGTVHTAETMDDPMVYIANLECLPDMRVADFIIDYFLKDLGWMFRVFHTPTFKQHLTTFISRPITSPMPLSRATFLPLYASCLCVALHLMDDSRLQQIGYDAETRTATIKVLSDLTYKGLVAIDWGQNHRIETLQAFIIIGAYWNSEGLSERHWTLLGTAVKIAFNLGISRLGLEPPVGASEAQIRARFGSRWALAADREVGRRVWFSLVDLDYSVSPEHHFTYVINPRLHRSIEPANIDDEDLHGFGPVYGKPLTTHTTMTFFRNRLILAYPVWNWVRKVVEHGSVRYKFVEEAHEELMEQVESLSPFYRVAADVGSYANDHIHLQRLLAEQRVVTCFGHLCFLRVHRFFLPQAYQDMKYSSSRVVAIRSAVFLLDRQLGRNDLTNVPPRYWPMNLGILTATLALVVAFCHATQVEEADLVYNIRQGIAALRQDSGSPALCVTAENLERLMLGELEDRASKKASGGRKRRREERESSQRVQKAVKRMAHRSSMSAAHTANDNASIAISDPGPSTVSIPQPQNSLAVPNSASALMTPTFQLAGIPSDASSSMNGLDDHNAPMWSGTNLLENNLLDTQDAVLMDFLRYTLPQWQSEASVWPPLEDIVVNPNPADPQL